MHVHHDAECELSHPCDLRRLRGVGEMLFDHSAFFSHDPGTPKRLMGTNLDKLREDIEA